jgi:hypothetical protein
MAQQIKINVEAIGFIPHGADIASEAKRIDAAIGEGLRAKLLSVESYKVSVDYAGPGSVETADVEPVDPVQDAPSETFERS